MVAASLVVAAFVAALGGTVAFVAASLVAFVAASLVAFAAASSTNALFVAYCSFVRSRCGH